MYSSKIGNFVLFVMVFHGEVYGALQQSSFIASELRLLHMEY
jgi:hypothetical protein